MLKIQLQQQQFETLTKEIENEISLENIVTVLKKNRRATVWCDVQCTRCLCTYTNRRVVEYNEMAFILNISHFYVIFIQFWEKKRKAFKLV